MLRQQKWYEIQLERKGLVAHRRENNPLGNSGCTQGVLYSVMWSLSQNLLECAYTWWIYASQNTFWGTHWIGGTQCQQTENVCVLPTNKRIYYCNTYWNWKVFSRYWLTLEKQKEFSPLPSFALRLPSLGPSLDPALSSHAQSGICTLEWGQDLASRSETQNWGHQCTCVVLLFQRDVMNWELGQYC